MRYTHSVLATSLLAFTVVTATARAQQAGPSAAAKSASPKHDGYSMSAPT